MNYIALIAFETGLAEQIACLEKDVARINAEFLEKLSSDSQDYFNLKRREYFTAIDQLKRKLVDVSSEKWSEIKKWDAERA